MNDVNEKCLELFQKWLETLGTDVQTIMEALKQDNLPPAAKRPLVGCLNYLFKALDLIPDGVEDIGYIDDAIIIRMAAKSALEGDLGSVDEAMKSRLQQLADDMETVAEFLDQPLLERLEKYAAKLSRGAAKGRTVDEIIEESSTFESFSADVEKFVLDYIAPDFHSDENSLVKLKAFLDSKLPG